MNIFVGNLAASVTAEDLRKLFGGYGTIIKVLIMRDTRDGRPLGHAHVYLVPDNAARTAITTRNGAALQGREIEVRECVPRKREDRRKNRFQWSGPERRRGQRRINGRATGPAAPDLERAPTPAGGIGTADRRR
jgi:RNA recognition motif-containing protein